MIGTKSCKGRWIRAEGVAGGYTGPRMSDGNPPTSAPLLLHGANLANFG